jgi:replicative DNA helicase
VITLPTNVDIERDLLGHLITSPEAYRVCRKASFDDKYLSQDSHREIFRTIAKMSEANQPIDLHLLCEQLDLSRVGGSAYVSDLTNGVVTTDEHMLSRCELLKRKYQLRRIIAIAEELDQCARVQGAKPEAIVADTLSKLSEVTA